MTGMTTVDGTTDYTYDATNQLTAADSDYTDDEAYTYDDVGNRVTADGDAYTTGDANRLTSDGGYRYTYDAEGNRTQKYVDADADGVLDAGDTDVSIYTWDYRNRLTEVDHYSSYANYAAGTSDQTVAYSYDSFNHLIGRLFDTDGSSGGGKVAQTIYAYDGDQVALQFDSSYTISSSNGLGTGSISPMTGANLSHRYLWNPQAVDRLFTDEALSHTPPAEGQTGEGPYYDLTTPGNVLWALTDHENTIRDLATYNAGTDATTVANHRVFDSYGNLESETNAAVECLFGDTGRLYDEATHLQNNLNRWYDSGTGRWLSEDPSGFGGGDANLYRYVGNNSLIYVDPSGLCRDFVDSTGRFFVGFGSRLADAAIGFGNLLKTAGEGWGDLAFAVYSGAFSDPLLAASVARDGIDSLLGGMADAYRQLAEDPWLALNVALNDAENALLKKLSTPEGIGELAADILLALAPSAKGVLGAEADAKAAQAIKSFLGDERGSLKLPGSPETPINGNSAASAKPQHGYEIYEAETGDVVKTGISGQPLNGNGTSPRANGQVNKWNAGEGDGVYEARVVHDAPNRQDILEWERQNAEKLRREGNSMRKHKRP
jgi:RHS repeat-associated protein